MFGPLSKKPARLGQWNGRRRSSRSDRLPLPGLLQRPVLLRLLVVLVTAVVADEELHGTTDTCRICTISQVTTRGIRRIAADKSSARSGDGRGSVKMSLTTAQRRIARQRVQSVRLFSKSRLSRPSRATT